MHALLADLVLLIHGAIVVFVVGGLLIVFLGNWLGWAWVNKLSFRLLHLFSIAVVVAESWLGLACPLTTLENALRLKAGAESIGPGFIEYWLQRILFYAAPQWVFILAYTTFGAVVAWAWFKYPPSKRLGQASAP